MGKLNFKTMVALKATLKKLASSTPGGVLCYGEHGTRHQTFCRNINVTTNLVRLCSCTRLEIHGIGWYPKADTAFMEWLKHHIGRKNDTAWWECCNPRNWLRYNLRSDLLVLALFIGHISYYLLVTEEFASEFRQYCNIK